MISHIFWQVSSASTFLSFKAFQFCIFTFLYIRALCSIFDVDMVCWHVFDVTSFSLHVGSTKTVSQNGIANYQGSPLVLGGLRNSNFEMFDASLCEL